MLGSREKCSNCDSPTFRRITSTRVIQCTTCKLISEERAISDLFEYHTTTQTEELHSVVTPDLLSTHIVDDIPNDPFCTPGFITAFRMLSPIREPVYASTARTISGSLSEMERVIGDALFSGYVGYNGRAPGAPTPTSTTTSTTATATNNNNNMASSSTTNNNNNNSNIVDKNKLGGDARHTLVAYFEIVELAGILFVDRETINLAVRIFRHVANTTSLRNRNVESLATASFIAAIERRFFEYETAVKAGRAWKSTIIPRNISIEEISCAANLDLKEIQRNLKVVNTAMRKQKPECNSSLSTYLPAFCKRINLPDRTRKLSVDIINNINNLGICARRNSISISAAAIYLACQLDGVRKTQMEICKATIPGLTEVTLRKVYKELNVRRQELIPDWFKNSALGSNAAGPGGTANGSTLQQSTIDAHYTVASSKSVAPDVRKKHAKLQPNGTMALYSSHAPPFDDARPNTPLAPPPLPPPLPPGLDTDDKPDGSGAAATSTQSHAHKNPQKEQKVNAEEPSAMDIAVKQPDPSPVQVPSSTPSEPVPAPPSAPAPPAPENAAEVNNSMGMNAGANALLAMMNNPAMKALADAFNMMAPPAPPPLPTANADAVGKENVASVNTTNQAESVQQPQRQPSEEKSMSAETVAQTASAAPTTTAATVTNNHSNSINMNPNPPNQGQMNGFQSMMGMMQMMQAFHNVQQTQQVQAQGQDAANANPFALMAAMMTQVPQMPQMPQMPIAPQPPPPPSQPQQTQAQQQQQKGGEESSNEKSEEKAGGDGKSS